MKYDLLKEAKMEEEKKEPTLAQKVYGIKEERLEIGNPEHIRAVRAYEDAHSAEEGKKTFKVTRQREVTITEEITVTAEDKGEARELAEENNCLDWRVVEEEDNFDPEITGVEEVRE